MVNQVKLLPEYWYGLAFCADELGYNSRQHLIEEVLKKFMESYPESMARGREKVAIMERAKAIGVKEAKPIEPIFMKKAVRVGPFSRIRLEWVDEEKEPIIVTAGSPNEAFFRAMGRYPVKNEFGDTFSKWEFVEK